MNRTIKATIGVIFVLIIIFSGISIFQNLGRSLKMDLTEHKLYTLSDGTRAILAKLHQPVELKLFYASTAALNLPDDVRYFETYYQYVKSLLEEYVDASKGMIQLEIIDPRPFSEEEDWAYKYRLKPFMVAPEENFFFGLVAQTKLGSEKVIPFFALDSQSFVEYDISYLIDTVITRQRETVGILSSLPVLGDEADKNIAKLKRLQNRPFRPAWTIVEQLRQQYDIKVIPADAQEIRDIDILLIIHPKNLPEQTLYEIDQFVLNGGKTIICVDPFCIVDIPEGLSGGRKESYLRKSDLNFILRNWGVEVPDLTFAGDRNLAEKATLLKDERPETLIGFLNLKPGCFNTENAITASLNQVRLLFSGVFRTVLDEEERGEANIKLHPLITTTSKGNSWSVNSQDALVLESPSKLLHKFMDGNEPVVMGYKITGRFKSCFPHGIDGMAGPRKKPKSIFDDNLQKPLELTEASKDCAVVVFSDVDFITDLLAYQPAQTGRGKTVVGDNSALLLNAIDDLCGSNELASIRSRGNFSRPFVKVDEIEKVAEAQTAEEEVRIKEEISRFRSELSRTSEDTGQTGIIGSSLLKSKKELELKIDQAQRKLRRVKLKKRENIEQLGNKLRNFNMMTAPVVILVIAIILSIYRTIRKRHYISHISDS